MRLQHCPHHSLHFRMPASSSPWLTILMLTVPSRHASNAPYHPYTHGCPPDMPLMPLTILMLSVTSQHASNATDHPYARIVPSQHASDAAYHPYTCIVPT
ncbi:hypothetical protein O181_022026 [Austropuccinia psidii MF-1]|uniref:Uncharacterized protein n=1 Tax=Austropuccinia psidii MF-1 TaxID=1389203 RepID=A0A9Q3CC27_9BASI|nr:hypothetical protein [Austropuccinia psidii MF-1]